MLQSRQFHTTLLRMAHDADLLSFSDAPFQKLLKALAPEDIGHEVCAELCRRGLPTTWASCETFLGAMQSRDRPAFCRAARFRNIMGLLCSARPGRQIPLPRTTCSSSGLVAKAQDEGVVDKGWRVPFEYVEDAQIVRLV